MFTSSLHRFALILAASAALMGAPAAAQEPERDKQDIPFLDDEEITEATRDAINKLTQMITPMLGSLSAMIEDLPRYEAPEILPNGDIIIRRIRPEDEEGVREI